MYPEIHVYDVASVLKYRRKQLYLRVSKLDSRTLQARAVTVYVYSTVVLTYCFAPCLTE